MRTAGRDRALARAPAAFPYFRNRELVNVKYRSLDKEFSQVPKAEKVLFGLDDCIGASEIIVVEGEMDKLALEEAGFRHVVSVPDGAPPRYPQPVPQHLDACPVMGLPAGAALTRAARRPPA